MYVHNSFKTSILVQSKTTGAGLPGVPEYMICSVQQGNSAPILVSVIYRPPHVPFFEGTDLVEQLTSAACDYSTKIIMGDFNANLLSVSADSKIVKDIAKDLALQIVDHGATHHHTEDSHTWIDAILVDENNEILCATNRMATFPSRHNIIDVTIKNSFINNLPLIQFSYRNYKQINQKNLLENLVNFD